MDKPKNKALEALAKVALVSANSSAELFSWFTFHQPKEPENLAEKLAEIKKARASKAKK